MNDKQRSTANELYKLLISLGWERDKAVEEAKRVVMSYSEVKEVKSDLFQKFCTLLEDNHLQNGVSEEKYLEYRSKYHEKVAFWKEINACVDWTREKGKRKLSTMRLRNWLEKARERNKFDQLKKQHSKKEEFHMPKKEELDPRVIDMMSQLASKMSF